MDFEEINDICIKLTREGEVRGKLCSVKRLEDMVKVGSYNNGLTYVEAPDVFLGAYWFLKIEKGYIPVIGDGPIIILSDADITRREYEYRLTSYPTKYHWLEEMYGKR